MTREERITAETAACGRIWAEQADRSDPDAWAWSGLAAEDIDAIIEAAGPDGDELEPEDIDDAVAEAAFYEAMGKPRSLAEAHAAFVGGGDSVAFRWDDCPAFGGRDPANAAGVWSWDATHTLRGVCAEDAELVERGQWAADVIAEGDIGGESCHQRKGQHIVAAWVEVLDAWARGERPDGLDDAGPLLARTAEDAMRAGWTGLYPATLRAAAIQAGASPTRGGIRSAVACDPDTGYAERAVGYWLAGERAVPWAVWAALRGLACAQAT